MDRSSILQYRSTGSQDSCGAISRDHPEPGRALIGEVVRQESRTPALAQPVDPHGPLVKEASKPVEEVAALHQPAIEGEIVGVTGVAVPADAYQQVAMTGDTTGERFEGEDDVAQVSRLHWISLQQDHMYMAHPNASC